MNTTINFWKWFQDNERAILQAYTLDKNKKELFFHLKRNLNYISKGIHFIIINKNDNNKINLFFTTYGNTKLFQQVANLKDLAPPLKYFSIHSFIKPFTIETENLLNEKLLTLIKQTQIKLDDYNIESKKITVTLFLPKAACNETKTALEDLAETILIFTLGEVSFKRHIHKFKTEPVPKQAIGLLAVTELHEFIHYLTTINCSKK
ncbi:hypothetical protein ACFSX9_04325 [Flavobacterium ardleyense]|uniref:Uncharacterized protein n=1 Tax=Flavobacterium ardleyense TaxID=2038737 RepID=A0ABW5Z534_9FLAO